MNSIEVVDTIRSKFAVTGSPVKVPFIRGTRSFSAELTGTGIKVNNLGNQPYLPWAVFQEAIILLIRNGGRAERGDAMNFKLGESGLSLDSVEGHIAYVVYGRKEGVSITRRITPIACILIWAGVCSAEPGELILDFK
ncbi:hypothetical protein ACFLV7_10795 [Chloroflexota bacterium]